MLLTHNKANLVTLFWGCRFCKGIKAISFIFMLLLGPSLDRSYAQNIDPLDLLNFDGTSRIDSLSSGSREFLELGVEFARCDALLFVIFGDSPIDDESSMTMADVAREMFEISYPSHARNLDFYSGLVGFDKQYEMWYEYGDIYSVSGPNLSKLLIIFLKGVFMTEGLKTSNEVPQGHLDLFISRRESAFSSALIGGNARHPEIHSKVSDCTSLGAYWGLFEDITWTQQDLEEKEKAASASFADSAEHAETNITLFSELEICSRDPDFEINGLTPIGPCGNWLERVKFQQNMRYQLGGAHKDPQLSVRKRKAAVDLSLGNGTYVKSTVGYPDPQIIADCTADSVLLAGEALLVGDKDAFFLIEREVIEPCKRELDKLRETPGLQTVRVIRGTSELFFSQPPSYLGTYLLSFLKTHRVSVSFSYEGIPVFFK